MPRAVHLPGSVVRHSGANVEVGECLWQCQRVLENIGLGRRTAGLSTECHKRVDYLEDCLI